MLSLSPPDSTLLRHSEETKAEEAQSTPCVAATRPEGFTHADVLSVLLEKRQGPSIDSLGLLESLQRPIGESLGTWVTSLAFEFHEDVVLMMDLLPKDAEFYPGQLDSALKALDFCFPLNSAQGAHHGRVGGGIVADGRRLLDQIVQTMFKLYEKLWNERVLLKNLGLDDILKISTQRFMLFLLKFQLVPAAGVLLFVVKNQY